MITINGINISDAVTEASISQQINAGASIMNFSVMRSQASKIFNGDTAVLYHNGKALFAGKVFSRSISNDKAEISAIDSLRSLKAVFPVIRKQQPASEFIKTLLAMATPEIKVGNIESIAATVGEKRFERQSLIELIYRTLDDIGIGYVLRDEAGTVCLKSEQNLKTDLVLDGANVLELKYQSTVGQSCNYIKLTSNSVENALSVSAVVSDAASIAKYGRCYYIAELDEKNPEQLMLKAKKLLEQNSGEKQKLWLTAVGDARAQAGNIVFVDIASVGRFWAQVTAAQHIFEGKTYTVELQLQQI